MSTDKIPSSEPRQRDMVSLHKLRITWGLPCKDDDKLCSNAASIDHRERNPGEADYLT